MRCKIKWTTNEKRKIIANTTNIDVVSSMTTPNLLKSETKSFIISPSNPAHIMMAEEKMCNFTRDFYSLNILYNIFIAIIGNGLFLMIIKR
jgi:hypothetical protein